MPGSYLGTMLVMKSSFTILLLTLSVLYRVECAFEGTFQHMLQKWELYRNECIANISSEPTPSGLFCTRMFDQFACWTDGLPNTTVKVPCPWYLPWYDQVRSGFVLRECGPDGLWNTDNTSHTWRDHTQCNANSSNHKKQEKRILLLSHLRLMYTIGYSLSVASLTLALIILLIFRKLRCTRNYIHANLFVSFILRAVSILIRDDLLKKHTLNFQDSTNFSHSFSDQSLFGCRIAQAVMQYCVGANYYWVLVEGLYLHNILVFFVFSANNYFYIYFALGWVTPVLNVVPWIVLRHLYENTGCWETNSIMAHRWIIKTPILLTVLVNISVFIRIIHIIVSKLKAQQMRYTDYKVRLAKSTLILLPLLGIHMVVCTVKSDALTDDLRVIQLFSELLFSSFQGFLVAILYCFMNKEVQSEIKRKWHNWKLGISTVYEQRTTSSHILHGASGLQDHKDQPCQLDCSEASGIHLSMKPLQASTQISLHQHHHQGAKNGKAYCYISAHKQVLDRLDKPELDYCELDQINGYSESYC